MVIRAIAEFLDIVENLAPRDILVLKVYQVIQALRDNKDYQGIVGLKAYPDTQGDLVIQALVDIAERKAVRGIQEVSDYQVTVDSTVSRDIPVQTGFLVTAV